jgi:ATP-dependent DNA ligase
MYEIKYDGFRALVILDKGHCRFLSRNKHKLHGFRDLRYALAREINAESAILDGD